MRWSENPFKMKWDVLHRGGGSRARRWNVKMPLALDGDRLKQDAREVREKGLWSLTSVFQRGREGDDAGARGWVCERAAKTCGP